MIYFELYPGDYLRDTTRLSLVEHGAYLRLLMAYYAEAKPLPSDFGELFVIVGAISTSDKAAVRKVADRFFPVAEDGFRRNARADREIEKARRRIETARQNGRTGGRPATGSKPKKEPKQEPGGNPVGFGEETQRDTQRGVPQETQQGTHSGEALHTPHAMGTTETSTPLEFHGAFEGERAGDEASAAQVVHIGRVTAAGVAARAARDAGAADAASGHPSLIDALDAGVSQRQIQAFVLATLQRDPPVQHPFAYACRWALRAHEANPGAMPNEASSGSGSQSAVSRVAQNLAAGGDHAH